MTYGSLTLTLQRHEEWPDYDIRVVAVNKVVSGDLRSVTQYHFTSWPDHGVPLYATPLLNFLRKVKSHHKNKQGLTVVHCR